jgi:O-antigen/teichoic acid export membrane protein
LHKSEYFKDNMRSLLILSGTELIAAVILNADRLILQAIDGGTSVTIFYAATLIGKMVSLISTPLNGVIIGHLTKYEGGIKKSTFVKLCLGSVVGSLILNVFCFGVSFVFVRIMYADIFELVKPYLWCANLGQVFYFIANTLTVILLRFTDEKYQLVINILFLIVFVVIYL